METLHKIYDLLQPWIATWNWYAIGLAVGSVPAVIGIVAYIKRRQVKKFAQKLESKFVVLNVTFVGFLLAAADFVITHGTQLVGAAPFLIKAWPIISLSAIVVHALASDKKKEAPKVIDTVLPNSSPTGVESFSGTSLQPIDKVNDPIPSTPPNLWQ